MTLIANIKKIRDKHFPKNKIRIRHCGEGIIYEAMRRKGFTYTVWFKNNEHGKIAFSSSNLRAVENFIKEQNNGYNGTYLYS